MRNFALKRRVLIVGEGRETEFNYFVGFRNAFEDQLDATATSVRVARGRGGNMPFLRVLAAVSFSKDPPQTVQRLRRCYRRA